MGELSIIAQLIAGWLLVDLIGGLFHWFEDRMGSPDWPILGRHVIGPNRQHHLQPLAFTRSGFISRNWTTWMAVAVIVAPLLAIFGTSVWLIAATLGGLMSNQVHYWAHLPSRAPASVRVLQDLGVMQSSRQHQLHHAPPHDRRYCVLTDWLNPLLDRLQVWSRLERMMPQRWLA